MKDSHVTTILVFALSIGLYATEYFVSPRGSEHHDGSGSTPSRPSDMRQTSSPPEIP